MTDKTVAYNGVSWEDLAASYVGKNVWVRFLPAEKSRKPMFFRVKTLADFKTRNGGVFLVRGETEDGSTLSLMGSGSHADKPAEFTLV